jgi:uncharacterized protein YuzE
MKHRYLEVTFRRGKPLAAYLYLPRKPGATVTRTSDAGHGMKIDYDADGSPMGVEITAPSAISVDEINAVLRGIGQPELPSEEWAPLRAA